VSGVLGGSREGPARIAAIARNDEWYQRALFQADEGPSVDAFGRWRTSEPTTIFDSKLLYDAQPLLWDDAATYAAVYDNQWVVQMGAQFTQGRYRYRAGYVWAENPISPNPFPNIGGIVQPGDIGAVNYTQALLGITSQHRISFGLGVVDVLPGIDLDVMAGGMFRDTQDYGEYTSSTIASYWIGLGMTWRFGRGSCDAVAAPERWCDEM